MAILFCADIQLGYGHSSKIKKAIEGFCHHRKKPDQIVFEKNLPKKTLN